MSTTTTLSKIAGGRGDPRAVFYMADAGEGASAT
jgi:hypothetical protein